MTWQIECKCRHKMAHETTGLLFDRKFMTCVRCGRPSPKGDLVEPGLKKGYASTPEYRAGYQAGRRWKERENQKLKEKVLKLEDELQGN